MESAAEQRMQTVPTDALECPICVEIPQGEIHQCRNGHSFCVACSTKLKSCPTCKTNLPVAKRRVRNRFMEELIGCTKIPCKYKHDGCGKLVPRKESVAHFESCEFRPFHLCQKIPPRGFRDCAFGSSKASEIFNHFAEHHHVEVVTTPNSFFTMKKANVDRLKQRKLRRVHKYFLFELKSSKGDVAKYLLYYRIAFPGDSTFMCLYMGEKKAKDVSPFVVEFTVKGISEEEQWTWEGRPKHYKKADVVVKSPPLKVCLEDVIENGEGPGLTVNFYEK